MATAPSPLVQQETKPTLVMKVECPTVPPLSLPHYTEVESSVTAPHYSYHSLGHCLRNNTFPGSSVAWTSLAQDSYVRHTLPAPDPDQLWHGRRTNEMMQWTERNIVNQKLNKLLKAVENKGAAKRGAAS